ncbi:hypothetical protein QBC35DRAFT_534713 [Podospora australis]|uniref:Uncharacterized protein n=1 Tax=Podospora australis TaxID=1536484 RepID=A0AAN6WN82_9PEZI|nr:hypothetical protein QBC35DRAFT_534713 [Podospora australis]
MSYAHVHQGVTVDNNDLHHEIEAQQARIIRSPSIDSLIEDPSPDFASTATIPAPAAETVTPDGDLPLSRDNPQSVWSTWGFEIGALVVSGAATVSAAVVLASYDGRPLDEWAFFAITLNTTISALGLISRVSLAFAVTSAMGQHKWNWFGARQDGLGVFEKFDTASRGGPWGSARLLLWSRATNLAAIGAVVTITTLLVDPLLQATVTLRGQSDTTSQSSAIPVASHIDMGKLQLPFVYKSMTDLTSIIMPDFSLTSAFYDGISRASRSKGTEATQRVEILCGTGNCTWPLYTTAALCSECHDVSKNSRMLKESNRTTEWDGWLNATDYYWPSNGPEDYNSTSTMYTLGYGHIKQFDGPFTNNTLRTSPTNSTLPEDADQGQQAVLLTAFVNANYSSSISFQELNTTVATLLVMRAAPEYLQQHQNWEDFAPIATECGLYICAKAYNHASATNGILTETEAGSWAIRESQSWHVADPNAPEWWDALNVELGDFDFFRTDLQVVIPLASEIMSSNETKQSTKRFNITQTAVRSIQNVMSDLFSAPWGIKEAYRLSGTAIRNPYLVYPNASPFFGNDVPDILWKESGDLTKMFEQLATRLSIHVREASNETHGGSEEKYVLHIQVQWGFFVPQVFILVLGGLYFSVVVWQTGRLGLPIWKEGFFPLLASGLDGETQERLRRMEREMRRNRKIKAERGKIQVGLRFDMGEGGWKLLVCEGIVKGEKRGK